MTIDYFDCRTGGAYRYVHRRGDDEFGFHGSFHEVRPDEVIVQTFAFEGVPDGVALEWARFEALADNRTRLTVTSLVSSFEERGDPSAAPWPAGRPLPHQLGSRILTSSGTSSLAM